MKFTPPAAGLKPFYPWVCLLLIFALSNHRWLSTGEGGHLVYACACKICSARSASFWNFQRPSAGFQLGDRHLFVIFFGEGWKSMTSLPPFLTLWILVEFAGSSDEDILMIKVRTKREKRPKTWSLRFDLLTIKMCTRDNKPWRLVLRCGCLTSVNHEVVCGGDLEIFVTIIEGSLEFDLILLQLWNKIALSSSWLPSFKLLQITSSFLSLYSHIERKALKNVPASGLSRSYYNLWRTRFWGVRWIFQVMAHNCLWLFCSRSLSYMVCRHVS